MFTKEQKAIAINLAMDIDTGKIPLIAVLESLGEQNQEVSEELVRFWMQASPMTKGVVNKMYLEKLFLLKPFIDNKHNW